MLQFNADTLALGAGSKSQSTKCIEYIFSYTSVHGKRVKVHVIDTPGLSDTEGRGVFAESLMPSCNPHWNVQAVSDSGMCFRG